MAALRGNPASRSKNMEFVALDGRLGGGHDNKGNGPFTGMADTALFQEAAA